MNDWKQTQFGKEYDAFRQELDDYYAAYPTDVSALEQELDEKSRLQPQAGAMEKKTWIYELAAEKCRVKLFRHCPFYFEVDTGAPRNLAGSCFPPIPGLGSWLMRRDTSGLEQEFQNWIAPYVQEDALNSTMYVDCAHHAMGVGNVLRYGLRGLQRQAQARLQTETDVEKQTFLRCVIRAEDAVMRLCARFADEAERLCGTERDPVVQARLARIAISARRCPAEPAETFFEALNTMLLLKELGNGLESMGFAILGHVDRVLAPYYARDVQLGRLTAAQAQELVYWFCAMTDAKWDLSQALYGTNTAMSIGGCDENGTPVFNDITRWVLQCYLDCGLINPKVQARFAPDAPEEYYQLVAQLAASGRNVLSVFNDRTIIAAQMRMGKQEADARLYLNGGCQEVLLADTEVNSRATCYLSPCRYLEMMLEPDGTVFFDREHIVSYDVLAAPDFETFYHRVMRNLTMIVNAVAWHYNGFEKRWAAYNPCPFFSSTITGCIEKAQDVSQGGAIYNNSGFALVGLADFIDSLYAIKEAVYEQKRYTLAELTAMLRKNYEGCELDRLYLQNKIPKVGADTAQMNAFVRRVTQDIAESISWMPNGRGGRYEASIWSFYGYEWMKAHCGALPDGRLRGQSLSRGLNPSERTPAELSAILHTMDGVDYAQFPQSAVAYFCMPVSLADDNVQICASLIRCFLACGGSAVDFDVLDSAAIADALEHPERHQQLVIRVCGYSARFVDLSREMQLEIAGRAQRAV